MADGQGPRPTGHPHERLLHEIAGVIVADRESTRQSKEPLVVGVEHASQVVVHVKCPRLRQNGFDICRSAHTKQDARPRQSVGATFDRTNRLHSTHGSRHADRATHAIRLFDGRVVDPAAAEE